MRFGADSSYRPKAVLDQRVFVPEKLPLMAFGHPLLVALS